MWKWQFIGKFGLGNKKNDKKAMSLYKFVSESRVDILENLAIRFSQPLQWNDPFEMKPYYFDDIKSNFVGELLTPDHIHVDQIDKIINENFVSLSLTENPYNLLMWAHYTKDHKGFLIEFDDNSNFFKENRKFLFKIPYSNIRPVLSKSVVLNLIVELKTSLNGEKPVEIKDFQRISTVFYKSIDWKDEQEWRLITLTKFADSLSKINDRKDVYYSFGIGSRVKNKLCSDYIALFKLPPESIKSVFFGCNANTATIRRVFQIRETNNQLSHLRLYQTYMDKKEYKLVSKEITPFDIFTIGELQKKGLVI